jgi:hypothetical protein
MAAESRLPLDELVRFRVRRGIVQRLVRDADQATLADQDREITVTSEGEELGAAKYGTCYPCGVGLLQRSVSTRTGRSAGWADLLSTRSKPATPTSRGTPLRNPKMRAASTSATARTAAVPWTDKQHPCLHFD